jgi:hypothetical protein
MTHLPQPPQPGPFQRRLAGGVVALAGVGMLFLGIKVPQRGPRSLLLIIGVGALLLAWRMFTRAHVRR